MIDEQNGIKFQRLAVHLAKFKWPEFIATQVQNDGGEDATTFECSSDGKCRRLACSLTGTLGKIQDDAERIHNRNVPLDILVFMTPSAVSNTKFSRWREKIKNEFGFDLYIIEQEEIITLLEQPHNTWLCNEFLGLDFSIEQDLIELEAFAKIVSTEIIDNWKIEYRYEQIQPIDLTLTQHTKKNSVNSDKQAIHVSIAEVADFLNESNSVILMGSPGAGKTLTLIQLANLLVSDTESSIPILLSLPGWVSSGQNFQDYLHTPI